MIITDEAAVIILALMLAIVLVLAGAVVGAVMLIRRGYRVIGFGILAAIVSPVVVLTMSNQTRLATLRAQIEALTILPDTLSLTGKRVLFIETGNTVCDNLCGDALSLAVSVEADWLSLQVPVDGTVAQSWYLEGMDTPENLRRVVLGAPQADLGGQRYAEDAGTPYGPPYDLVVIDDFEGLVAVLDPGALGGDLIAGANPQIVRLAYDTWPDPFATPPPPEPTFRTLYAWINLRRPWAPFSSNTPFVPTGSSGAAWIASLCAEVGPETAPDPTTYAYRCAPEPPGAP